MSFPIKHPASEKESATHSMKRTEEPLLAIQAASLPASRLHTNTAGQVFSFLNRGEMIRAMQTHRVWYQAASSMKPNAFDARLTEATIARLPQTCVLWKHISNLQVTLNDLSGYRHSFRCIRQTLPHLQKLSVNFDEPPSMPFPANTFPPALSHLSLNMGDLFGTNAQRSSTGFALAFASCTRLESLMFLSGTPTEAELFAIGGLNFLKRLCIHNADSSSHKQRIMDFLRSGRQQENSPLTSLQLSRVVLDNTNVAAFNHFSNLETFTFWYIYASSAEFLQYLPRLTSLVWNQGHGPRGPTDLVSSIATCTRLTALALCDVQLYSTELTHMLTPLTALSSLSISFSTTLPFQTNFYFMRDVPHLSQTLVSLKLDTDIFATLDSELADVARLFKLRSLHLHLRGWEVEFIKRLSLNHPQRNANICPLLTSVSVTM